MNRSKYDAKSKVPSAGLISKKFFINIHKKIRIKQVNKENQMGII